MMEDYSALCAAMAKAFPKIEGAAKDAANAGFKGAKYATLSAVVDAIKPALVEQGLFFTQMTHEQPGGVCVETVVCHDSGERMSFGKLYVPASKQDAQGYGSALTYARRYSLMTAFGVCPEDDDGNAAVAASRNAPIEVQTRSGPVKLDGPYTSPTALKNAVHRLASDISACSDEDMLVALMTADAAKELKAQIGRDARYYWTGGDEVPADYVPLGDLIANKRKEFAQNG